MSNTVAWDSPGALNAINIGNDIFSTVRSISLLWFISKW